MASHVVVTTTSYSALPFNDGDDFTGNAGCRLTADQNGKAGANCVLNADAFFYVDPGVNALFNSGGNHYLQVREGGRAYGNGASGNNAVIGGDGVTDAGRIEVYNGGQIIADYTTFQYFSNAYGLDVQYSEVMLRNCIFSHFGTNTFRGYYGSAFHLENCTWGDNDCTNCFFSSSHMNYIVMKNCTMKSSGFWLIASARVSVKFVGSTTYDQNLAGPAEPNGTNDNGAFVEDYQYYPELVLSEGNSLSGCSPALLHPGQVGGKITDSTIGRSYNAYYAFDQTDGSGDVKLYPLQKVFFDHAWYYYSDSGQAEAGDNQKFTIGLSIVGYLPGTVTAWADGGTASITLVSAVAESMDYESGITY